jgi:ribosome-associated toxin RatA of RatAB toxin-antitoxin module
MGDGILTALHPFKGRRIAARRALFLFALLSWHAIGQDFNGAGQARLEDGGVLIESVTSEEGIRGLRASFLIKARPEAVWDLLTDYTRLREVLTNVEELSVLEESPQGARVRFRVRAAWMDFQYTLQRNYEEPGRRLTYRRVEGDLKSISGDWVISKGPDDEHQLVISTSFVDAGLLVPDAWVRSRAADDLRDTARRMRQRLEQGRDASGR